MGARAQHRPAYRKLRGRLKALREEADLTQRALGKLLKKPHTYVFKCEAGERRMDPLEFVDWCQACGVDPLEVLREFMPKGRGR